MTGSGTQADPYKIYNVTDLQNMELDLTAYYELANDIDAAVTVGWNGGAGFVPIGQWADFTGQLDGKGYAVDQLFISRIGSWAQGLITMNSGIVKNLGMTNCNITGKEAGSICCENHAGGIITKCYSTGTVSGRIAGGFVGENQGTVTQCCTTCAVTATNATGNGWAGGFTTWNTGTIRDCYARGALTDNASGVCYLAGFVEDNDGGTVEDCYSTGAVPDTDYEAGFGFGDAATNCFWDTEASGLATSDIGTGKTTAQMKTKATFTDASWDFTTVWGIYGHCNNGYPCLQQVTSDCSPKAMAGLNPALLELLVGV